MKTTKKEYKKMIEESSDKSKTSRNSLAAFLSGGVFCTIGQFIYNTLQNMGIDEQNNRALCSIILVFFGAFFTAIGLYDKIAKFAGAGSLVPITGFANSVVSPAIEFKSEGHITGIGAKMFVIAGPVLVFGTISSIVYGIIVWIFHLY
jgi:stage V sporulation protein AC